MTKARTFHKTSRRIFAIFMAIMFAILSLTNKGVVTVNAESDVPKRISPILSSFDRNYLNYYNTMNKIVEQARSIYNPRKAIEKYLKTCNITYSFKPISYKNDWDALNGCYNFTLYLRDFTCIIESGTSKQGAVITLRDKAGFDAVVVSRKGNQAIIQSNDGPVKPWVKNLNVSSKDSKVKPFIMRGGEKEEYIMTSADVAMIITTIGGFYGSKSSITGQKTGITSNVKLAEYVGNYLKEHRSDAEALRNYINNYVKEKNGKVKESDFSWMHASRQADKCTEESPHCCLSGGETYSGWRISHFMWMDYSYMMGSICVDTNLWPVDTENLYLADNRYCIDAQIENGNITIFNNKKVVKKVSWSKPDYQLSIKNENGQYFIDSEELLLGIMIDRALYNFASTEGLLD